MILVDSNLLIYAYMPVFPQHERAKAWLGEVLNGEDSSVGLPWLSLLAFLRIVTNPRVTRPPASMADVLTRIENLLANPVVFVPQPGEEHVRILRPLLLEASQRANLVGDAHLAALAIEHGLTLCSSDADFARFPALRWTNPLREH